MDLNKLKPLELSLLFSAYNNMGSCYFGLKNYEMAKKCVERGLTLAELES